MLLLFHSMKMGPPIITAISLVIVFVLSGVNTCNEAICGSVVSKCLLTQSCQCDLESCSCCKECFNCLGYLFSECCSCVDLCPKRNDSEGSLLSKKSSVEEFVEPIPALFSILTEYPDPRDRWSIMTFPVDIDVSLYSHKKETLLYINSADQKATPQNNDIISMNCTVVFLSQCLGVNKCRKSCRSMGSNSYRWFHDGCCECIGENCINFGINESRCKKCPEGKEDESNEYSDDYDYGEDEPLEEDY